MRHTQNPSHQCIFSLSPLCALYFSLR